MDVSSFLAIVITCVDFVEGRNVADVDATDVQYGMSNVGGVVVGVSIINVRVDPCAAAVNDMVEVIPI